MAITDELREYAQIAFDKGSAGRARVETIADRIDAAHESACTEAFGKGVISVPIAIDESAWVKLPLDADGVPIRIGDVLDEIAVATYPFVPAKVVGYHECCGEVLPIVENDGEFQVIPEKVCHYHAPTVEDVLREFAEKMNENLGMYTSEAIDADEWRDADRQTIAEYATKLRLAEGVE